MDIERIDAASDALECCLALTRIQGVLARRLESRLGSLHGLSFADFAVMLYLGRAPGQRLRRVDLAAEMGLTASAVTRMLIPMEKIGLVTRKPDPRDARVGYAALTKTGLRLLKDAMDVAETMSKEIIGPGEKALLATLTRLSTSLGR